MKLTLEGISSRRFSKSPGGSFRRCLMRHLCTRSARSKRCVPLSCARHLSASIAEALWPAAFPPIAIISRESRARSCAETSRRLRGCGRCDTPRDLCASGSALIASRAQLRALCPLTGGTRPDTTWAVPDSHAPCASPPRTSGGAAIAKVSTSLFLFIDLASGLEANG